MGRSQPNSKAKEATSVKVQQAKVVETGSFSYIVTFSYKGNNLQTSQLARTASEESVKEAIWSAINGWDASRAEDNFTAFKARIESGAYEI